MSTVNAFVAWLGSCALLAIIAAVFGSGLLRLLGIASIVVGLTFLLAGASQNTADAGSYLVFVPMTVLGLALWVTGHRLHWAQQGYWKSTLAATLWHALVTRLPSSKHGPSRTGPGRVRS